jgi:adenylosuccinate lyase
MRANVDALGGYLASEPVMRALADRVGKHTAQDLVYQAAMAGRERGVDLRTALEDDRRIAATLHPGELERLLDPAGALGAAGAFVDRVLARRRTMDRSRDGAS